MLPRIDAIRTARLVLRPFDADDVEDVWDYQREAVVARYMPWRERDRDEVAAAVRQMVTEDALSGEGDCLSLAVTDPGSGTVIGQVELVWLSETGGLGEIGFVFSPRFQGQGMATEAVRELLRLAFERLGLHRVVGRCVAGNSASAALLRRVGMRQEAHFVEGCLLKGRREDELVFAVLRSEWRRPQK
ncbi:N-acetyltransferase [Actinoplanes philippinensis]|uniref:Protein N-acetyltransferase, RimJ/RimL family n=2 Tax=Actinoplanes philippinensis TaxID=35752 RepID=A0A1I2G393_9ACTN|nr:N-acetyltransferase [Actinoplanes philippinensis]SFF11450.1 Protein N-acetyltransferase, RimJ/RimL family [Actinoplanes philippinensis]